MIIDIFKNDYFKQFQKETEGIIEASKSIKFCQSGEEYDLANNKISIWFDPTMIKQMVPSRSYPDTCAEMHDSAYEDLVLFHSNYLGLFLIPLLYADRKNIAIEDFGAGIGHFLVYLSHFDFYNFHVRENFSQMSKPCLDVIMNKFDLNYYLNDSNFKAIVTHNSGATEPSFVNFHPELELIICYTNRSIEKHAADHWYEKDFVFLCKDKHDFAFAYCRKDKYDEFSKKLKDYIL